MLRLTHTQVSNDFIDTWLSVVSGSASKCFIAVCRKTIGWHKETDYISISQMQDITGLSNRVVIKAVNELEEHRLIIKCRTQGMSKYSINYSQSDEKSHPRVTKGHSQSDEKSHTKETHKHKLIKETHKHKYGEFKNVLLTDEEYQNLTTFTCNKPTKWIDRLDEYIEMSGKKYKSHYATLRNWYRKDNPESRKPEQEQKPRFSFKDGCDEK